MSNLAQKEIGVSDFPLMSNGQKFMMAGAQMQAQNLKSFMQLQSEIHEFMRHRCEQNVKLLEDMFGGEELNGPFHLWSHFLQNAAEEYASEAGKIVSISSKIGAEAARRTRLFEDLGAEDAKRS